MITSGIERRQAESVRETLYSECISHLTTAQTKAATFHGREAFLGEIKQRIVDGRRYDLILVMINPAILIESVRIYRCAIGGAIWRVSNTTYLAKEQEACQPGARLTKLWLLTISLIYLSVNGE